MLATVITGGNPDLQSDRRNGVQARRLLATVSEDRPSASRRLRAPTIENAIESLTVTPADRGRFPERFVRNVAGQLVSADLQTGQFRPFANRYVARWLRFHQAAEVAPSLADRLDQLRQQFGFGPRGGGQGAGNANQAQQGASSSGAPPEGGPPPGGPQGGAGAGGPGGEPRGGGGGRGGGGAAAAASSVAATAAGSNSRSPTRSPSSTRC